MLVLQQFEAVIQAAQRGDPIDLSQMPPPPGQGLNKVQLAKKIYLMCLFFK